MHPITAALPSFREHLASKLATLPPASEELKLLLDIYERMQSLAISERIEEDLGNTYGPAREKLYATFLRAAALRERIAARNAREKAALLRQIERENLAAEQAEREQQKRQRDAARDELLLAQRTAREDARSQREQARLTLNSCRTSGPDSQLHSPAAQDQPHSASSSPITPALS